MEGKFYLFIEDINDNSLICDFETKEEAIQEAYCYVEKLGCELKEVIITNQYKETVAVIKR